MREGRWSEVASRGHTLTWMRLLECEQEHIAGEGRGRLALTDAIFYKRSQEVFWPEDGSASWETWEHFAAVPGGAREAPSPTPGGLDAGSAQSPAAPGLTPSVALLWL